MSKDLQWIVTDDLTGEESPDVVAVPFQLDDVRYAIDLNAANRARLRELLEPFISKAIVVRRVRPVVARAYAVRALTSAQGAVVKPREPVSRVDSAAVRAEIREVLGTAGYKVKSRGRIPERLIGKYLEIKNRGGGTGSGGPRLDKPPF